MCIDINICAYTYFSFAYIHTDIWSDASQARVQFKMSFLDSVSGYQAVYQIIDS